MTELFPRTGIEHHVFWDSALAPPSYVYVIQAGQWGAVKIGKARNVYKRIASLQTGCPEGLRLLYVLPGDERLERHLHRMFSMARLHGEWFDFEKCELMLEAVCRMADGMKAAFEVGEDDYDDPLMFDKDGSRLTHQERKARHEQQWRENAAKHAVTRARLKQHAERQRGEYARAHSYPTFSPHKPPR